MSGYDGGGASRTSKVLKGWWPRWMSAGSDIDLNYDTLRNRAADLARNTALGAAAITASSRGVIGTGLKLYPRPNHKALGLTAEEGRDWSRRVMTEFELWSETCDFARRNNFYEMQHIAYESYLTDGDCFVLFRREPPTSRNPYTLRLQLLEGNRVSTPYREMTSGIEGRAANGNRIINGIEVDEDGRWTALYVSNRVPNDVVDRGRLTEWARVEAFGSSGYPNVLQISHDIRAGQYRGVPYLASVIETLKQMSRYTTAELSSAIVKSFFSLFFTQPESNFGVDETLGEDGTSGASGKSDLDISEYKLGTGTLTALPRGVDVKTVDSGQSQSTFGEFMRELETAIGAALGLPREVLLGSFNASYSASRAALLQANDEYKRRRSWFIRDMMRPVYEAFLTEAVWSGRIEAAGYFDDALRRRAWSECDWHGPALGILDPIKEVKASEMRVALGLSTRQKESAELTGTDYELNREQLLYEGELQA